MQNKGNFPFIRKYVKFTMNQTKKIFNDRQKTFPKLS